MGRPAQRRVLRRSRTVSVAQFLFLYCLSGLFPARVVPRGLRRAGLQQLLSPAVAEGAGRAGLHRLSHALSHFEGSDDAAGGGAVR